MKVLRDSAWEIIESPENLLKIFNVSIFWVLGYKPWKNDAELIEYLNKYRKYREELK